MRKMWVVYYRDKKPTPPETGEWAPCAGSVGTKAHAEGFVAGLAYLDFSLDCETKIEHQKTKGAAL